MKRMMILALGLVLGMSLSVTAFAADKGARDVTPEECGITYDDDMAVTEEIIVDESETEANEITESTGTNEIKWKPDWMSDEKTSAEEIVIRTYVPSDENQEVLDPLGYILDNYNAERYNYQSIYKVVPNRIYFMTTASMEFSLYGPNDDELVIVNRVFEEPRWFGSKRMADVTIISTGERINLPMSNCNTCGYGFHEIYKVKNKKYSQVLRDQLEWER